MAKSFLLTCFFLAFLLPASAQVTKEYVRLGGRLIAMESNAGNLLPSTDSASPSAGTGSGVFTFTYSDPNGVSTLQNLNVLINFALDGSNACYFGYNRPGGVILLVPNNGDGSFATFMPVPSAGTLANSQCQINGAGTTVQEVGNSLILTVNLSFQPTFTGRKAIYMAASDTLNANSGWQAMGQRTLPFVPPVPPQVTSLSPTRSTALRQTYSTVFTHPAGISNFNVLNILINSALDGGRACFLAYVQAAGELYLVNDVGDDLIGPLTWTSSTPASIANSQCRIHRSTSNVATTSTTVTLNLDIELFSHTMGGNRIFYAAARDTANNNSGWQIMGTVNGQ